jgi:dCMP deaminase
MYSINKENPESWDEYWFNMCVTVASNSKCLSRKIGACIVLDNTIISTGYNGPPRKIRRCDERWLVDPDMRKYVADKIDNLDCIDDGKYEKFDGIIHKKSRFFETHLKGICPRYLPEMGFGSGEGLEWCVAGHAERNAIVNSAREGLHALKGCKLYMTCGVPCKDCMVEIINAGIDEIITDLRDPFYDKSSKYLLNESGIKVRQFDFIDKEYIEKAKRELKWIHGE